MGTSAINTKRASQRHELQFTLGNQIEDITPISEEIAALISGHWSDSAARTRKVLMALQEALSNAVLHGNLGLSSRLRDNGSDEFFKLAQIRRLRSPWSERTVSVGVRVSSAIAEIVVSDQGAGFDPAAVRSCVEGSGIYKMSGRGIALMDALMDNVIFSDGGRTVTLILKRSTDD